jgi:chaperonin GroES
MSKIKIQPLGANVVLETKKIEEKTKTGIILPDTAEKETSQIGKVIAVGLGAKKDLKIGDVVLYDKFGMEEIEIGEEKFLIGAKSKILGIIK